MSAKNVAKKLKKIQKNIYYISALEIQVLKTRVYLQVYGYQGSIHQLICAVSFAQTARWEDILTHSVWQTANKFGKKCTNLSLKFRVLRIDGIERQFLPNLVCQYLTIGKQSLVKLAH